MDRCIFSIVFQTSVFLFILWQIIFPVPAIGNARTTKTKIPIELAHKHQRTTFLSKITHTYREKCCLCVTRFWLLKDDELRKISIIVITNVMALEKTTGEKTWNNETLKQPTDRSVIQTFALCRLARKMQKPENCAKNIKVQEQKATESRKPRMGRKNEKYLLNISRNVIWFVVILTLQKST